MNKYYKELLKDEIAIKNYFNNKERKKEDLIKTSILERTYQEKLKYKKFYNLKNSFNEGIDFLKDLSKDYLLIIDLNKRKDFIKKYSLSFIEYCIKNNKYNFTSFYLNNTFNDVLHYKDNVKKKYYLSKKIKEYLLKNGFIVSSVYTIDLCNMNRTEKLKTCDNDSYQYLIKKYNRYKNIDKIKSSCISINSLSWKLRHNYRQIEGFSICLEKCLKD